MSFQPDQSAGSAREIQVPEDTQSALVREIVQQLNQQEIPIAKTFTFAGNGTLRIPLGTWRYDAWIKDIRFINATASALANAATDLAIKTCSPADCELASVGGPTSPTTLFIVEGFNGANFPAGEAIWGDEFEAGTNCDAVTGESQGNKVDGGDILYGEIINTEGGAAEIIVMATVVTTDYLRMFSGHTQPGDTVPYQTAQDFQTGQVHWAPQFKVPYQPAPGHFFHTRSRRR